MKGKRDMRTVALVGFWGNTVVCIYAAALAFLNLIASAADIRFVAFYVLVAVPFLLRDVFAKMRIRYGPVTV